MQISSILDIVEGELLNTPSISFIYNIKTQLSKVHEGDLFVAYNEFQIQEALNKGAFGILFDFETNVSDKEIAWIKVKDTNFALSKLIRYKLSNMDLKAYYCNKVSFELLSIFLKNNQDGIQLLSNDLNKQIEELVNLDDLNTLICQDQGVLDSIYPNNSNFNSNSYAIKNLIEHSLFETTFSCGNRYFSRLKLPSLYVNSFLQVYSFFENSIDNNKLKKLNLFKPFFIDKYFKMIEYGNSDKFILSHTDEAIALNEIEHLKRKYSYAKTFVFAKYSSSLKDSEVDYKIESLEEIKKIVLSRKFNAVYIVGFHQDEIQNFITKNSTKSLL